MNKMTAAMTALTVLASTPVWAFDGPYAGVQVGYNNTNVKYTESDGTDFATLDGLSMKGADYGVFAGYGKTLGSNFYLGGEVEYNGSNAKNEITSSVILNSETKKKSSYGVAARAGYVVDDKLMPYVRLGYNRAKFEQEVENWGSGDETKGGIAYGAGVEYKATDSIALRGEFVRTSYGKMSVTDGTDTTTYKPTESVARVGISYRF